MDVLRRIYKNLLEEFGNKAVYGFDNQRPKKLKKNKIKQARFDPNF